MWWDHNIFGPTTRIGGGDGPCKSYPSPDVVTLQNLIVPCHTILLHVGVPKNWDADADPLQLQSHVWSLTT